MRVFMEVTTLAVNILVEKLATMLLGAFCCSPFGLNS